MKNQINLEITQPCTENFNNFTPTKKGGFCTSCQKEVIDFSKMNATEIVNYFKKNSNKNTCGKFNSNQLKTYTNNEPKRKKYSFWSGIGFACLALFSYNTSTAQTKTTPLNTSKNVINKQEKEIVVTGTVTEDGVTPLPGVSILLQGKQVGTETDFDGKFKFPQALKEGDVLIFSFVGMESQKVVINNNNAKLKIDLNVSMKYDSCVLMGKVAVKKIYSSKK